MRGSCAPDSLSRPFHKARPLNLLLSIVNRRFIVIDSIETAYPNLPVSTTSRLMMNNDPTNNRPGPDLSLTPDQQDLLLTALASNRPQAKANSNARSSNPLSNSTKPSVSHANSDPIQQRKSLDATRTNPELYKSPLQESPSFGGVGSDGFDESPLLDFEVDDENYDWDNSGEKLFGSLPGAQNDEEGDLHDKRKSPEDEEDEESGHKRREGEDKSAKRPGRKPLTGEPTTVKVYSLTLNLY